MAVVDHRKRRALGAHELHAARRRRKRLGPGREPVCFAALCKQHGGRLNEVRDVEAAHLRKVHRRRSSVHLHQETRARLGGLDVRGLDDMVGRKRHDARQGRRPDGRAVLPRRLGHGSRIRVVDIDDRGPEAGPGEKNGLGFGIGVHGNVVVKMIARQICEDGRVEMGSRHAALLKPDRTCLDGKGLRASLFKVGVDALKAHGVGRRERGHVEGLAREPAAHRAHDGAGRAEVRQKRGDPVRGRRLAVRARHGDARHPRGRIAVEGGRHLS